MSSKTPVAFQTLTIIIAFTLLGTLVGVQPGCDEGCGVQCIQGVRVDFLSPLNGAREIVHVESYTLQLTVTDRSGEVTEGKFIYDPNPEVDTELWPRFGRRFLLLEAYYFLVPPAGSDDKDWPDRISVEFESEECIGSATFVLEYEDDPCCGRGVKSVEPAAGLTLVNKEDGGLCGTPLYVNP